MMGAFAAYIGVTSFGMQELEYWDDRPRYTGLPEEEKPKKIEGQKQITGSAG